MKFSQILSRFILALTIAAFLGACDRQEGASSDAISFTTWGPQSAEIGSVPNQQPDGGMGVWIEVSGKKNLGDFQVFFDGKPLGVFGGGDQSITASVPPALLGAVGSKEIAVKRLKDGKLFVVGSFIITAKESDSQALKK